MIMRDDFNRESENLIAERVAGFLLGVGIGTAIGLFLCSANRSGSPRAGIATARRAELHPIS
jgi:hypothetical protein